MGWVVNATPRPLYPRERDPVPIVEEAGWAPGSVWTGAGNRATLPVFDLRTVHPVARRYTKDAVAVERVQKGANTHATILTRRQSPTLPLCPETSLSTGR